jgi:hypothetical protein
MISVPTITAMCSNNARGHAGCLVPIRNIDGPTAPIRSIADSQQGVGPPAWGFGGGLTNPHHKKSTYYEMLQKHWVWMDSLE